MDSKQLIRRLALCGVSMAALLCNSDAFSNPQGGNVVAGDATITSSGKKLDVHQKSNSAIIDWNRFDIDVDEHTQFHQPSANATALNRVKGHDPSNILGKLTANGNIILINPNGVFFGRDSVVDVNGLIATTADINNDDFMAGKLEFNTSGNPDAAIINEGLITAKEAGLVGLVAPNVLNSGIITAKLGKVQLASGDTFAIDLYGDGLYSIAVSDDVVSQLVVNTGKIEAEGGKIAITAAAAKEIVNSLIVIEGELKAPTIEEKNGKIIISASGSNAVESNVANEKGQKEGSSNIVISNALIDTSGYDEGEQGGEIEVLADNINILENTVIDASGYEAKESTQRADGGTATLTEDKDVRSEKEFLAHENRAGGSIKIGGDYLGKGDTASAEYVYVDPFSLILNDAIKSGDGGRTIIWSDNTTEFYGNVYARGGLEGGNGGFLETSGKINLKAQGYADLTSEYGYKKGTYLLDPANITIYGNVDPTFVSTDTSIDLASDLQLWLDGNDIDADNDVNDNPVNGTSISTWYDKSGKSNDAFTVSATKPVFDNSSIYGKGSVQFNGNSHFDTNLSINSSVMPNITVFSVYTLNAINGGAPFGEDNSSWDRFILDGIDTLDEIVSIGTGKINNYDLFNGTNTTITSVVWKEDIANGSYVNVNGINNNGTFTSNTGPESSNTLEIGALGKNDFLFNGLISETIIYNVELSNNSRHLIDQYQSAKWNIDLTPPGTGGTESAKAMASDGYSIFAVDYLEKLSSTADIVLQADNTITLDLKGDNLSLTDDRNISFQTTNGNISTGSAGTITTNRTTTGGNITFTAGGTGDININHALTLNAQNVGDVTFNASGDDINITDNFNVTTDNFNVAGNLTGSGTGAFVYQQGTASNSLDVGSGGIGDNVLSDALITDLKSAFASYSFGRLADGGNITNYTTSWEDPVTFLTSGDFVNAADTSSDDTMLIRAGDDIILSQDISTTSSTTNSLVLSAGDDFVNNAGSDALSSINSRWLVYSDNPTGNIRGSLLPSASEFNKTYAGNAPNTISSGNRFIYATATQPTFNYQVDNQTITYGDTFAGTLSYISGLLSGDTINNIGQTGSASFDGYTIAGTKSSAASSGTLFNALGYDYNFTNGTLTVNKATLDVSLSQTLYTRRNNESNPEFELSFSGFKFSDTASSIDALPIASTIANSSSMAGLYQITLAGGSDDNYLFSYTNPAGQLQVTGVDLPTTVENTVNNFDSVFSNNTITASKLSAFADNLADQNTKGANETTSAEFDLAEIEETVDDNNYNIKKKKFKLPTILNGLVQVTPELVKKYNIKTDDIFYTKEE